LGGWRIVVGARSDASIAVDKVPERFNELFLGRVVSEVPHVKPESLRHWVEAGRQASGQGRRWIVVRRNTRAGNAHIAIAILIRFASLVEDVVQTEEERTKHLDKPHVLVVPASFSLAHIVNMSDDVLNILQSSGSGTKVIAILLNRNSSKQVHVGPLGILGEEKTREREREGGGGKR